MRRLLLLAALLVAAPAFAQTPFVKLRLAGMTTGGVNVADEAAIVRFLPDARTDFDPNDASKLFPFTSTFSIIAPVGERNGARYPLSVNSLPDGSPGVLMTTVSVPVDFLATNAASYTLRWDGPSALPAGWDVYLRDFTTGALTNLRQQSVYAFSAAATGGQWVPRFQLVFAPTGVTAQPDVADLPGWRLLSAPVTGVTPTTLAALNLVQGVPAGTPAEQFPAQYPLTGSNLFTGYDGAYTAAATTGEALEPGHGFFWLLYDQDITPPPGVSGGGTSRSVDLRGFSLGAFGTALADDVTRTFPRSSDGYVMAGNPFAASFAISGITAAGEPVTTVQAYDADGNTYRPLFSNNPATGTTDAAAPWQGFFAEVAGVPAGTDPALTYAVAATQPTDATFYGRGAPDALAVHLVLSGTTAAGTVRDEAAYVRMSGRASAAWDADDAGKLTPPPSDAPVALVALGGTRDGAAVRQSVVSLPVAPALVPVAFTATEPGTFELRWDEARIPTGWTASLRDLVTGTVVDLGAGESYAFEAAATEWADRFELRLADAATAADAEAPSALALGTPTPNPASGVSRLRLVAAQSGHVRATVVDALGRTVATVFDGDVAAGAAVDIAVDVRVFAPGTYTVRVVTPGAVETRRLVVIR